MILLSSGILSAGMKTNCVITVLEMHFLKKLRLDTVVFTIERETGSTDSVDPIYSNILGR